MKFQMAFGLSDFLPAWANGILVALLHAFPFFQGPQTLFFFSPEFQPKLFAHPGQSSSPPASLLAWGGWPAPVCLRISWWMSILPGPLFFSRLPPKTVTTFLNRPNLAFWKSKLAILLTPFPFLRPESSSCCDHCAQGSPQPTHHPPVLLCSQKTVPVRCPPWLAHSPGVSGMLLSHIPGISWTLSSLLGWICCRYLGSWTPTMRMRTADSVTSPNILSISSSWSTCDVALVSVLCCKHLTLWSPSLSFRQSEPSLTHRATPPSLSSLLTPSEGFVDIGRYQTHCRGWCKTKQSIQ